MRPTGRRSAFGRRTCCTTLQTGRTRSGMSRIVGTPAGLRVEVAAERQFAIAAMSGLGLRKDLGQIRVRVAEMGGGATWFVRLYGELRQSGQHRTAAIAQDEAAIGERVFPVDPRLRQLPDAAVQLQLGVEGPPGAFVVFEDVDFLAPVATPKSARPPALPTGTEGHRRGRVDAQLARTLRTDRLAREGPSL